MNAFDLQAAPLAIANRFKIQVIQPRHVRARDVRRGRRNRPGKVVHETDWQSNLILDQGMDRIAVDLIANLFTYCVIGTGNTPTEDDSGATTATTSGTTCTATTGFFNTTDVGKLLRFSSGQKSKIASVPGAGSTTCTLADTLSVGSATAFKLYRVTQTGLATERTGTGYRNNTYLTGSGNCGSSFSSPTATHRRTYDFPIEVSNQNYSEVGFSHSATVAANLNMRALFSGGAVTVLTGQQLRVIYDVVVTISPVSLRTKKFPITGWPSLQTSVTLDSSTDLVTLASHGFAADTEVVFGGTGAPGGITFGTSYYVVTNDANSFKVAASPGGAAIDITSNGTSVYLLTNTLGTETLTMIGLSGVNTSGSQSGLDFIAGQPVTTSEPSATSYCNVATDSTAQAGFPVASASISGIPSGGTKVMTNDAYTNGTFTRTKSVTYTTVQANSSAIRQISIGDGNSTAARAGLRFLFNHPQEKTSLNTLTIRFRFTWDRDFS